MERDATPLGIIAGAGALPLTVAKSAAAAGRSVYTLRLKGFDNPSLDAYPGEVVGLGEVGRAIKLLKAVGVEDLVICGIVNRPDFGAIRFDLQGAKLLPKLISAAREGDDALLRVVLSTFEKAGFRVLAPDAITDGLSAGRGLLAGPEPSAENWSDLRRAADIAAAIGQEDIGQGCVVCRGLVLAVEAQEGTDAMLQRVRDLPAAIRGAHENLAGVLVKRPKPIQERRVDLPVVGAQTIERAHEAGLAGVGVFVGEALILDAPEIYDRANALDVFLYGLHEDDMA
ncbi:MAG: UDP-2,3-diacylglucosamine diphosphatase LpxI [Pseudomonadota bacterium]